MAAENSNTSKLKLKTYTSARKSTFTLVTLQSFSISDVISGIIAEKCKLKNEKFTDVFMTGGMTYTPSHANVCKIFQISSYISQTDITPTKLKLCKVTKVKVLFPVLVSGFHSVQF